MAGVLLTLRAYDLLHNTSFPPVVLQEREAAQQLFQAGEYYGARDGYVRATRALLPAVELPTAGVLNVTYGAADQRLLLELVALCNNIAATPWMSHKHSTRRCSLWPRWAPTEQVMSIDALRL